MVERMHRYLIALEWTGNLAGGTTGYCDYSRNHVVRSGDKPALAGSSDRSFRGDADRWSPEELLVASLAACHQLWYLHLCAEAGVVVTAYVDHAEGLMREAADGLGAFERVILRPEVTIAAGSDMDRARALHAAASAKCFIARSVNFQVQHQPRIVPAA